MRTQPPSQTAISTDLSAGLVVFLVALPLCLGIALASGAPLFAGIIAGVIGGIVVGMLSGSALSVSGPAAGLVVIVVDAIRELDGFAALCTATLIAGVIQVVLGYARAGVIGEFFPNSVIRGTLAGIGAVILLKQVPHALGRNQQFETEVGFWQSGDSENMLSEILLALHSLTPLAVLISVVSLAILIAWEYPAMKKFKLVRAVPAPLVVVVLGTLINELSKAAAPSLTLLLENRHLVALPAMNGFDGFLNHLTFPDFSALERSQCYITAIMLAVVASLESLVAVEAVDRMDPHHRITPTNRELKAQGVGNIFCGLLGGLPVTSVVVRSSANLYAGAQSKIATMFNGFLLLVGVAAFPFILNRIPLSALAAILIMVGYKLCHPKLFRSTYKEGWDQFAPFLATFLALVFTDLLKGISLGVLVGIFFVIRNSRHDAVSLVSDGDLYLIRFNKDLSFLHKAQLKEKLLALPDRSQLIIDGVKAQFIDHDIWEVLIDFRDAARYRGISIEWKHLDPWRT